MFLYSNCRTNNDGIAAKKQYPKFLVIGNRRSVIREPAVKAQQNMRQKREASRDVPQSERESETARGEGTKNFRYQYLPLTKAHAVCKDLFEERTQYYERIRYDEIRYFVYVYLVRSRAHALAAAGRKCYLHHFGCMRHRLRRAETRQLQHHQGRKPHHE